MRPHPLPARGRTAPNTTFRVAPRQPRTAAEQRPCYSVHKMTKRRRVEVAQIWAAESAPSPVVHGASRRRQRESTHCVRSGVPARGQPPAVRCRRCLGAREPPTVVAHPKASAFHSNPVGNRARQESRGLDRGPTWGLPRPARGGGSLRRDRCSGPRRGRESAANSWSSVRSR
jgi:hypothetical protein